MAPPTLSYSSKPPSGRVGVRWRGADEVEITLPPRWMGTTILMLLFWAVVAIVCFAAASDAGGTARFAGGFVRFSNGTVGRIIAAGIGLAAATGVVAIIRQARTWTRFDLHDGTLTRTLPTLIGIRVTDYPLSDSVDVTLSASEGGGPTRHLVLHRRSTNLAEMLLENTVYREADLEEVVAILRQAIKRGQASADQLVTTSPPAAR